MNVLCSCVQLGPKILPRLQNACVVVRRDQRWHSTQRCHHRAGIVFYTDDQFCFILVISQDRTVDSWRLEEKECVVFHTNKNADRMQCSETCTSLRRKVTAWLETPKSTKRTNVEEVVSRQRNKTWTTDATNVPQEREDSAHWRKVRQKWDDAYMFLRVTGWHFGVYLPFQLPPLRQRRRVVLHRRLNK